VNTPLPAQRINAKEFRKENSIDSSELISTCCSFPAAEALWEDVQGPHFDRLNVVAGYRIAYSAGFEHVATAPQAQTLSQGRIQGPPRKGHQRLFKSCNG
jgi:hypothetical protein